MKRKKTIKRLLALCLAMMMLLSSFAVVSAEGESSTESGNETATEITGTGESENTDESAETSDGTETESSEPAGDDSAESDESGSGTDASSAEGSESEEGQASENTGDAESAEQDSEEESEESTEPVYLGEPFDFSDYIRVGLYWSNNCKQNVTLQSDFGFVLCDKDGNRIANIPDTSLSIDINSEYLAHREYRVFMSAAENPDDRIVTLITDSGTKKYRDAICLYENSGLRVINYVDLEHYIWGVVNKEMSSSYPIEALKAQAVSARTYAWYIKTTSGGNSVYGFDVTATTSSQVYGGYSSENSKTTQACEETKGQIMTYNGSPIFALFSAYNAGGYTMSIYDAWGLDQEKYPYLGSVEDPYTPVYTWATTYTFDELRDRIKTGVGIDVGNIYQVEVADTNSFGAVTGLRFYSDIYPGGLRIPRSQIMSVFNLKSTYFCIGDDAYNDIELVEPTPENYSVATVDGVIEMSTSDLYVCSTNGINQLDVKKGTSYSMTNDVCCDGYVYMNGMGYGHGIGLSQVGAKVMARDYGYTYDYILQFYYQGVTIEDYHN